jgi:ferredoxin, 2Fe-2S
MPRIKVLPHAELCPQGTEFEAQKGQSILDALLEHGVDVEHACEKSCACTTCHVILREGFESLEDAEEKEEDLLDKAWGLEATSRLSCQARLADADVTVEIPKYTINYEREGGGRK